MKLHNVAIAMAVMTSTHGAVLMQWNTTLVPDVGTSAVVGVATWEDGAGDIVQVWTFDSAAMTALSSVSHVSTYIGGDTLFAYLAGSPFTFSTAINSGSTANDWREMLDGAPVYVGADGVGVFAEGFWTLAFDNRVDPEPPVVTPPDEEPIEEPEIPEPSTYGMLFGLGLAAFAAGRRLCHA